MLGDVTDLGHKPSDNRGMTPRIFEYLFSKIRKVLETHINPRKPPGASDLSLVDIRARVFHKLFMLSLS